MSIKFLMTCNLNSTLIEQSINYILHFSEKFSIKYTCLKNIFLNMALKHVKISYNLQFFSILRDFQ